MRQHSSSLLSRAQRRSAVALSGPLMVAFLPALSLAVYWFGGEGALIVLAGLLPVAYLAATGVQDRARRRQSNATQVLPRAAFEEHVGVTYDHANEYGRHAVLFIVAIEELDHLIDRFGQAAADTVIGRIGERLCMVMRDNDQVGQLGDARFGICAAPVRHLDLEMCIQLAARMQTAIEDPVSVDGLSIYVTASVGFCQHARVPGASGTEWTNAANTALREAQTRGPSAVRAFSVQMRHARQTRDELRDEVIHALDDDQIRPWYQPQISTDTGKITGFESLARWIHPTRGVLPPSDFLPAIEDAGQLERLAEVMMYHAFAALNAWDKSGLKVPQIGVNFAGSELNNPRLVEKIKWELDRFDLTPDRLAVEVLETVVASAPDDMITRNIIALGELGCRIDLDDFGTGHASIASIRRFAVSRIKIDRSFVTKADRDPEQQRMISAILTMAERLQVETLAEGVETVGEHVLLAQLGCDHVQGFGIARPMALDATADWIKTHNAKLTKTPRIMDGRGG